MSGLAQRTRLDAAAMSRCHTFRAWRIVPGNPEAIRLDTLDADTLDDAIANVLTGKLAVNHKDFLAIEEADAVKGTRLVHIHAIKRQSQPQYRRDPQTGRAAAFHRHYPQHLFTMQASAFEPVEPWRWEPGCDVVGHDFSLIEARP